VLIREFINRLIATSGYKFIAKENYDVLVRDPRFRVGKNWSHEKVPSELRDFIFKFVKYSNAQIQQDLFASWVTQKLCSLNSIPSESPKYFVEFGATNGFQLSNSFYLEKYENWEGLLAEPAKVWHDKLSTVRKCKVDFRCVYSASGLLLSFTEASNPELGTISQYKYSDNHFEDRLIGVDYEVETVSLNDLFTHHNSPNYIDYLSVETEGSEYEILEALDYGRYSFGLITVEHNYTANRQKLQELLVRAGYVRVLEEVSGQDDWYVANKARNFFD